MTIAAPYKAQATRLSAYLESKFGLKLKRAVALEAIARTHGRRDWNELAGGPDTALTASLNTPQAVAAPAVLQQTPADIRVSLSPASDQSCEAQLHLETAAPQFTLSELGMTSVETWKSALSGSPGILLVCGHTGSGKTATLQASADHLRKIGSTVHVVADEPYTQLADGWPAKAFGPLLAIDAETYVIDELRDTDHVALAILLAKAGKRVLAGVHAGTVHGALDRLEWLGTTRPDVLQYVRGGLTQRLVRLSEALRRDPAAARTANAGKFGRTIVSRIVLLENASPPAPGLYDKENDCRLVDDALEKACRGELDLSEIVRVFGPVSYWR